MKKLIIATSVLFAFSSVFSQSVGKFKVNPTPSPPTPSQTKKSNSVNVEPTIPTIPDSVLSKPATDVSKPARTGSRRGKKKLSAREIEKKDSNLPLLS